MKIYIRNINNLDDILFEKIVPDTLLLVIGDSIVIDNMEYKIEERLLYFKSDIISASILNIEYIIYNVREVGKPRFVRLGTTYQCRTA